MNGKGDSTRPRSICGTEWDQRWAQTFNKQGGKMDGGARGRDAIAAEVFERHYPGYEYTVVDRAIYLQIADALILRCGDRTGYTEDDVRAVLSGARETKHETRPVICDRCNGTGEIVEQDLEQHTTSRACPSCLGQAHVCENITDDA